MKFLNLYFYTFSFFIQEAAFVAGIGTIVSNIKNPNNNLVFGIILTLVSFGFILFKIKTFIEGKALILNGEKTKGIINSITSSSWEHNGRTVNKYQLSFTYQGEEYYSSKKSAYLRELTAYTKLTVFFDKQNPENNIVPRFYDITEFN